MNHETTRRTFLVGTGLAAAATAFPVLAQDKPRLRFSAVFSEQDIRAEMMKMFADAITDDFTFEGYYGGNLFKQGTELVAIQRGNLEMGNIAPQDISKQIPAWSIVTAGYLFRDAAHMRKFFDGELGAELKKMTEDQLAKLKTLSDSAAEKFKEASDKAKESKDFKAFFELRQKISEATSEAITKENVLTAEQRAAIVARRRNDDKRNIRTQNRFFVAERRTDSFLIGENRFVEIRFLYRSFSLVDKLDRTLIDIDADHVQTAARKSRRHACA